MSSLPTISGLAGGISGGNVLHLTCLMMPAECAVFLYLWLLSAEIHLYFIAVVEQYDTYRRASTGITWCLTLQPTE